MIRNLLTAILGLAVLAVVSIAPFGLGARASAVSQTPSAQAGQPSPPHDMAETMKHHQQMMTDMKAADAKLDELVATMNAANGDGRMTAVVRVVNELVRQQKTMHEHMEAIDQRMMMPMGGRGMTQNR